MGLKENIIKTLKTFDTLPTYKIAAYTSSSPIAVVTILEEMLEKEEVERTKVHAGTYWKLKDDVNKVAQEVEAR